MDIKEVYKLMGVFEASGISELALELEGMKIALKKAAGEKEPGQKTAFAAVKADEAQENTTGTQSMNRVEQTENDGEILIKAPLVGTFYRAASPEETPFVVVGQQIKKGDVVGIIEAMKLMNEITAPEDGTVVAIEVKDGDMAAYDQVLIRLAAAGQK